MSRPEYLALVRRDAFAAYYAVDGERPLRDGRPHPRWQAPFMPRDLDEGLEARARRVLFAGQTWLRNPDLGPANELVIQDEHHGLWYLFRRPQEPGELDVVVGPHPGVALTDGDPLPEPGLRYVETVSSTPYDELHEDYRVR
jgi:hypothetical protein